MTVILEAVSGPVLGRRIEVRGGSIVRIGRAGRADHVIAEDGYLSGAHFSVECDGTQCRIRDLGSSNGTFVNGARVTEQLVREGDSVVAGGSTFRIHVDQLPEITGVGLSRVATAPIPVAVGAVTMGDLRHLAGPQAGYSPAETALLSALYASGEQVFAIVDASRDSRIPAFLDAAGESYSPLDPSGRAPAFLVALPRDTRLVHVLIKDGWGRGWGFYGTSKAGVEKVRAHFTSFVSLRTDSGAAITFRFWDPRVLRALVPVMPQEEADHFFGPCERIIVEAERAEAKKPMMALEFSRTPRGPRQQTLVLG
jgi:pSer/pThr/pTyr-binding forkhead associated (FHA) protein